MRELVGIIIPMPSASLSTHSASVCQAFPSAEARPFLRRLEFLYTLKHASRLNMVAIEIGVLRRQCLDRRIDAPTETRQHGSRVSRHSQRVIIIAKRH
jgi:hypothetical protein